MAEVLGRHLTAHDITLLSLSRGDGPIPLSMEATMRRLWPCGPVKHSWITWEQLARELLLFRTHDDNDVYVEYSGIRNIYICTMACDPERGQLAKESDGRLYNIGWWGIGGNWTSAEEGLKSLK